MPAGVAMDREGNDSFNLTILSSENEVQPWPKGYAFIASFTIV